MATKVKRQTPNSLKMPDDYRLDREGLTQSLLSTFLRCRKSFIFSVNKYSHVSKIGQTNFGSMFHDVIANIYAMKKIPTDKKIEELIQKYVEENKAETQRLDAQKLERDIAVCWAVVCEYVVYYRKEILESKFDVIEKEFCVEYRGILLRGKIDARYLTKQKVRWQMEHKTKGRISENTLQKKLTFDPQNLFYLIAGEIEYKDSVAGVLYNIVRNPQIKQKVNESLPEFIDRIRADIIDRPDFYFLQFEIPYTERDKTEFRKELDMIIDELKDAIDKDKFYKNGFACDVPFECQYLEACSSNSFAGYTKREKIFSELNTCDF